jgi:mannan endo-1,4-beta-mannosidase
MTFKTTLIYSFCTLLLFCGVKAFSQIADKKATVETKNLYKNIKKLTKKGIMFGHQDALAYGVGWKYQEGRNDVKEVTGQLPAVFGWDLAGIEKDSHLNIDSVPFSNMKRYIKQVYDKGLVNTISWHLNNPLNDKTAWDETAGSVASILPNGPKNQKFNNWLDKLSVFMLSLKGSDNKPIPILFRPFHELTGSWFWWGKKHCSPQEFKQLWQYTYNYLNTKGVHNLIYVYNTSGFESKEEFLERYPGDQFVDMVSFDTYDFKGADVNETFVKSLDKQLTMLGEIAKEHKKIPTIGEAGYEAVPYPEWWTKVLMKGIADHKISYVLIWRNAGYQPSTGKHHYYAPYPGQVSEKDFVKFFNLDKTFFENEVAAYKIYK